MKEETMRKLDKQGRKVVTASLQFPACPLPFACSSQDPCPAVSHYELKTSEFQTEHHRITHLNKGTRGPA